MGEQPKGCGRVTGSVVGEPAPDEAQAPPEPSREETTMSARVGQKAPDFQAPAYHKGAFTNVKLSDYFWLGWLRLGVPQVPDAAGAVVRFGHVVWREIAGVSLLAVYFLALPPLLGRTLLRRFRHEMGRGRYTIMVLLLLMMLILPVKMVLRWTMNLSYIVSMPEYFLNF